MKPPRGGFLLKKSQTESTAAWPKKDLETRLENSSNSKFLQIACPFCLVFLLSVFTYEKHY